VLLRLAYLGVTNVFALLRLLPVSDRDKEVEILALRHQIMVLERQLVRPGRGSPWPPCCTGSLRMCSAVPAAGPARDGAALAPGYAGAPPRGQIPTRSPGPATHRPLHPPAGGAPVTGEPLPGLPPHPRRTPCPRHKSRCLHRLGDPAAGGIEPAAERTSTTWASFLRSQADALLACDFFETVTLTGARLYVLAVIEHASRRIRVLGATPHPSASWVAQAARNLVMDLEDAGSQARFMIRDRDGKFPCRFDAILADAGVETVLSGVQIPRMNVIMERWVQTCRRELLDRTLIWNQAHLLHALREFEQFYNSHRPHQGIANARPLRALPSPIPEPDSATRLDVRRRDRLGGILHEYLHAA
jgi:putative transposase